MNFVRPIGAMGKNKKIVTGAGKTLEDLANRKKDFAAEIAHLEKTKQPVSTDLLNNMNAMGARSIPIQKAMGDAEQALSLGKRNLGIAGVGGAGLLGSNMLSHHLGYGSGNTEGFNRGGEAGWAGGQQQGMEAARKAYGDSGFLSRLMSSFSPNDPGAMQGVQYQAYNPQVAQALKEISKAMQASGQKAKAAPAVR